MYGLQHQCIHRQALQTGVQRSNDAVIAVATSPSEMFCLDKRRENTGKFFLHLNWNTFTFKQSQSPPGASHSQIKRKKRACLNRGCEIW